MELIYLLLPISAIIQCAPLEERTDKIQPEPWLEADNVTSLNIADVTALINAIAERVDRLELDKQEMATRMEDMQAHIDTLETQLNATDAYAVYIDRRLYVTENQVLSHRGKLSFVKSKTDTLESAQLKTNRKVRAVDARVGDVNTTMVSLQGTVADISASLTEVKDAMKLRDAFVAYINDFSALVEDLGVVPFNRILLNQGNGFDPASYKFTCQYSGMYLFSTSIVNYYYWHKFSAHIVKDGRTISASAHGDSYARELNQGAVTTVTHCRKNEQIWVQCTHKSRLHGGNKREVFTQFTGTLLQIDM